MVQALGSCSASGARWSSAMLLFFGKGRETTTTTAKLKLQTHYYVTKGVFLATEEYSSLSSAAALLVSLTLNAAKSSIPFGSIKRHLKDWWSAEVEEVASEKRKAFAAARRIN